MNSVRRQRQLSLACPVGRNLREVRWSDGCAPSAVERSREAVVQGRVAPAGAGTRTAWPMSLVDPTRTTSLLRSGRSRGWG